MFLRLSDLPNDQDPTSPWEIEPNVEQCFYAYTTTDNPAKDLPVNYDAYVLGHADTGVSLVNDNLKEEQRLQFRGINNYFAQTDGAAGRPNQICTTISPDSEW